MFISRNDVLNEVKECISVELGEVNYGLWSDLIFHDASNLVDESDMVMYLVLPDSYSSKIEEIEVKINRAMADCEKCRELDLNVVVRGNSDFSNNICLEFVRRQL